MERNEAYIVLLDRFMWGETSAEEEARLLEWFRSSGSRESLYHYYQEQWEKARGQKLPAEIQSRMFQQIRERMKPQEEEMPTPVITHPAIAASGRWYKWGMSAAAVALLCVCLTAANYYYRRTVELSRRTYVVAADKGQRSSVVLPDGTKIWLNSHTRISYQGDYGENDRIVNLTGEAFFEVAKDQEHRFVVKAEGMEVEALGTAFNVKAYQEDDDVTATLYEGKVQTRVGQQAKLLNPDESLSYNKKTGKLAFQHGDVAYNQKWRDNELAFKGETLEEIAVLLDRMYNVKVCFESENIKHYRFSGVIKNNSLDNVFELISLTAPIEYTKANDTIQLKQKR